MPEKRSPEGDRHHKGLTSEEEQQKQPADPAPDEGEASPSGGSAGGTPQSDSARRSEESVEAETPTAEPSENDLQAQLEEALREKEGFRALLQRTQADFVNYRKRVQAEQEEIKRNAIRPLVTRLLEGMDSLDAALHKEAASEADQRWIDGVRAVQRSFENVLASVGVERFESSGDRFDPRFHEALSRTETAAHEADTVIQEIRAGYKMGEEVLRPALVEVAAPLPDDAEE